MHYSTNRTCPQGAGWEAAERAALRTFLDNPYALSLPEVYGRLSALGQSNRWEQVWTTYATLFERVLVADQAVAEEAIRLRAATSQRPPTIDALIAATTVAHRLTLVHRDPHLARPGTKRGSMTSVSSGRSTSRPSRPWAR